MKASAKLTESQTLVVVVDGIAGTISAGRLRSKLEHELLTSFIDGHYTWNSEYLMMLRPKSKPEHLQRAIDLLKGHDLCV